MRNTSIMRDFQEARDCSNSQLFNSSSSTQLISFRTITTEDSKTSSNVDSLSVDQSTQTGNFDTQRKPLDFESTVLSNIAKHEKDVRTQKITELVNQISTIIQHDEFFDGEVSQSELFMENAYRKDQLDYVADALMQLYSSNLLNPHVLEGILVMVSSVPYEAIEPKGQIMAMGLLANKELTIRDRAIQCFERWNSKKGLIALKSLACHPKWLQAYVNKVIMYIERDGTD